MGCEAYIDARFDIEVVSIHAPVWGANPATDSVYVHFEFQSTHPCGVRTACSRFQNIFRGFNPRTRVGCERQGRQRAAVYGVSIHAPVWGANTAPTTNNLLAMFQSTHPCGVRIRYLYVAKPFLGFNPRTRVGCEHPIPAMPCHLTFQSTHPCGVRNGVVHCQSIGNSFNPRTRVGCEFLSHPLLRP